MKYLTHHALACTEQKLMKEQDTLRRLLRDYNAIYMYEDLSAAHDSLCDALDHIRCLLRQPYEGENNDNI
jgi:hypothetical protein